MPQQASAPDFSDVDQFVQGQKGGASSFDDIDSFVAGQARGAPAAATKFDSSQEIDRISRGATSFDHPDPSSLPLLLQPPFPKGGRAHPRTVAEGLTTEQEERHGGMPLHLEDNASVDQFGREGSQPGQHIQPSPLLTQELSDPGGREIPKPLQNRPVAPLDWKRALLGTAVDVATGSGMPGAEMGPGYRSLGEPVVAGVNKLSTPGERGSGALQLGEAGVEALTPLMGPAAIENPANIVRGLAEGTAASEGGGYLLGKTKMSQEDIDNAKALLFFAPGVARSIIDPKLLAEIDPQRTTVGATVAGGRAGAGVRVTPQDVTIGGKIGPFSGSKTFSRGAGAPELEPPTIEGTPGAGSAITPQGPPPIPPASDDPLAQAAGAMNAKNDGEARAARQVQGIPEPAPPAPPAPPQPPPIHEVTPEMAHGLAQTIQKLPPEVRAQALIEMHGKMAEQLLRQGKVVGPDGKLEVIDSPKAADRVAQAFINDEVERQDKLAEEQAKNKPAAAAPKPASNPNDNIIAQAKALPRESDFSDVDTFVKENTNESSSERASVSGNKPQGEASGSAAGAQAGAGNNQPTAGEPGNAVRKTGREAFTKGDRVQLEDGRKATVIYTSPEDPFVRVQIDGGGKISKGISKLSKLGVESGNAADHDGSNSGHSTGRAGARGSQEPGVRPGNSSYATDGVGRRIVASDEGVPGSVVSGRELGSYGPPKADFNGKVPEENLGFNSEPAKDYGAAARENTERRMGGALPRGQGERRVGVESANVKPTGATAGKKNTVLPRQSGQGSGSAAADNGTKSSNHAIQHESAASAGGVAGGNEKVVPAGAAVNKSSEKGDLQLSSEGSAVDRGGGGGGSPVHGELPKFKFGNTQAPIPEDSEAHRALESARARISPEDLAGKGSDVGGNHVTVRYGIKGKDTEGIKKFLSQQSPFEASLGKTEKFPPSEHSEGAAVIKAPIESPELHRLNAELEQHGEFTEPSFKDYKPHATVAYVKPEKADRYVGMSVTHGKKFTVSEIAISKQDGSQEVVKLEGKSPEHPSATALVPKQGGDGKHYVHLSGEGAPTMNVRIDYADQASAVVQLYRDKYDLGSSQMGEGAGEIFDPGGKQIGHVSYNGRVWSGTAKEWKAGAKPLQEAYDFRTAVGQTSSVQDAFDRLPRSGFKVTKADIVPIPEGGVVAVPHETPTDSLINAVYNKLKDGESLGNVTDLNKLAEEHLGSSRTSGQWTPKDVFDAMEAGVNKYLLDRGSSLMALPAPQGLKMLRELMPRITSQGVRTDEQIKNQQFSTPPTESYIAAKVAGLKPSDVVLEPSAGNGGLAVWPKAIGAEVHVNETSPRRQEILQAVGFGKPTAHDGEIINSLLDPKIKPTVVLMNPPFSASTLKSFDAKNNNQYGFNHVDSALQRLEDGGRLVAILGGGQANEPNGGASLTGGASGKWFERIAEKYNVRANIRVHGKEYQKYGTAFATRLIVIDKDGATPSRVAVGQVKSWASVKQANVNTLEEAYDALKDVAESRPEVQHEPRANKHENQPRTGVEPSGGAGAASDRVPVRSSGEAAPGNELPGGSHRPVGSVGGNEASAGDRGTAVRQPEVQSGNHPETKAARSAESRSQDVDGERQLSGTETSDAALSLGRDKSLPVKEEEDSSAYVAYHPTLKGPAHPANIVETRTMATVPLPEITYRPSLPESVIADKKLSAVQLEAVSIAGQQNDIVLPDGSRATALIGDGTGVGKGRIGAAVLWDNWRKGRRRLVWVSEKWDLMQDAIRDLRGIGAHELAKSIKPFGKISASTPIDHDGILFTTYALIRSEDKKGNSRVNQLQQWMKGKDDANGAYILYDESHNLKNAVAANAQQVSQIGKAVKKMMLDTPNLRSVSLSATAATDVINLGYLDRLGLWGPGTPFPNGFGEFQAQIASGGMSAMEMVARELKAQGKYLSRTLSYKGVTYEEVEHVLTEEQKDLYRTASKAWASVVQQAEDTIKNTTNGGAQAKARFMSLFYGAQLRFFNVLLTTLKIPTAVEQAKAALADNKSVVITLVNTNEAAQNREKNRDRGGEDSDEVPDYDFGPGEMLKDLVREHYPTQQFVDDVDSEGNPIKVPAYSTDAEGRKMPLINPQAVKERDHLIAQLDRDLKMPANPLDILINSLGGPKKVAELTGRKERYDESSGKFVPRGDPTVKRDEINLSEMRSFQAGKKRVAILSSAAGTGISLHAGNDAINQEKRRHITLQPGWSADKAMQMMGRTHRSNEAHPPEYKTIVSDLGGEKRFSSTLAKRMGSLGALSKGQSNANAGSDLMEKVNFESDQGRQATTAFYNAMLRNIKIPGVDLTGMQILHDLRVLKPAVGGGGMTVPPADRTNVTRLLNRLLALDPDVQNGVYNYFYDVFQATVQQAVEDGTLDTGVKTLPGDEFTVKEERAISKEPKTGAETYYYPVDAQVRTNRMSPVALDKALKANAKRGATIMRNKDGKVQLVMEASPIVHASGSVTPASYVVSPENGNPKKVPTGSLYQWESVEDWAKTAKDKAETAVDRAASSAEYVMSRYKDDSQPWARRYITDAQAELDRATTELEEADKAATDTPKWAREQWEKQYAEAPAHTTKEHYLIGGAVLRWWNPIREASEGLKIYTAVDSKSGKRVVGVDISPGEIKGLLARITGGSSTVDASQLHTDVLKNGLSYTLEGGIEVKRGRVNRQSVVQFIPPNQNIANTLKGMGLIYERGVQPVYYLPNAEGFQERDRVADMLAKILKEYPVKAEVAKPESLLTGESGELNVSRLAEVVKNFADQDIKPTLEKAGVGIRDVAALGLKALYPRVEQSNPIGSALKAAAPSDAVDALMEVQGDRAKNLAEFDLILKGIEKMFDHLPEEQRIEFVDRIQTGKEQPSPDLLDIAEMFKKIMDGQRDAEEEAINLDRPHHITATQKSPIELARKENYFHNWWETRPGKEPQEDEAERISSMFMPRRPLEGSKGYNKRQSYTLKSGIEAGGEPVTTNPVRILRHRLEDGMKWITARRAWHELGQLDLKTFVAPGDRNPPGFDSIDDKIAKVYFPAELASGKTAIIPGGRYAVEANTARLLNNMLSVDKIRGNALGRGLMWLKNMSTALELGWSPFHAVFESIEAMSSMMSLGMQRGYNQGLRQGKPEELLQGLKEIISSPAAPISLAREGAALPAYIEARARLGKIGLTEFGHVISGDQPHGIKEAIEQFREVRKEKAIQRLLKRYPDLDQLIDDMFQGGLVVGQHRDYQVKALGKTMTEAWTADNPLGAVWRAIPTIGQGVMYPLFNIYIPNLKYSLFLRMMSEQVSEHSRELEDGTLMRATLARRVADSVENRFGELNFDTLFLNRSVKTALQFAFRSATYKMGTAREIAGGVGGQTRELAVWAHEAYGLLSGGAGGGKGTGPGSAGAGAAEEPESGKTFGEKVLPRLDMRASWIMSLLLTSVILGAVAARLNSKKWPWEWLEDDEDLPGGTLRHLYLETIHPRTGETDSRGKPVRVSLPTYLKEIEHASTEPVKYVLGSLSSILSRGLDLAENRDFFGNYVYNPHATLGTKLKQGAEYMEPVPFVYSSFERGKQQGLTTTAWLSAFGFPKAPSDLDFTPAEKLARSLVKHQPETPEELEAWRAKREALEDGTATREEVKKYLRTQRLTWLQRQVKGMGYGDALDVMEAANDSERAELVHIIDTKRKNALKSGKGAEIEELEEEHSK